MKEKMSYEVIIIKEEKKNYSLVKRVLGKYTNNQYGVTYVIDTRSFKYNVGGSIPGRRVYGISSIGRGQPHK